MTIKQFLKPDWRKLIILTFLIPSGSMFLYPPSTFLEILVHAIFMGPSVLIDINPVLQDSLTYTDLLIKLIIAIFTFFYWYLLSCFIVWVYDKVKKKK